MDNIVYWNGFQTLHGNIPLPRPGVYLLTHLDTGKKYVGATLDVSNRGFEHSTSAGHVPQLQEALKLYKIGGKKGGKDRHQAWSFEPIYYTIDVNVTKKSSGLLFIEADLIKAYDSINHGWNLPHPDVLALSKLPEALTKRAAKEASTETKARRAKATRLRWQDPDDKLAESVRSSYTPERAAKISASRSGTRLVDGTWKRID